MTIPDLLRESLERYKDNILFNYFNLAWKTIRYHNFGEIVKNISFYLRNEEIKKGDRVAVMLENRPEWNMCYLGIVSIGAIAVPIYARSTQEEVRNLLNDSEAVFTFFSNMTSSLIPEGKRGLNVDSATFNELYKFFKIEAFKPIGHPISSDIASIIYTSGTTGKPKGVMLSHENLCSDAIAAIQAGIVNEKDNVLSILPLHHTYPFMCTLLVPIIIGASITYPPSLKAPDLLSTIKEKGVTIFVAVPQVLEMIRDGIMKRFMELPFPIAKTFKIILRLSYYIRSNTNINIGRIIFRAIHRRFGSQFRFFTSGGAHLDPSIFNDLEALGFTVLEGYGLTETSPIVSFNLPDKRKAVSVGKPIPTVDIKILNPSESGEGEIVIMGPMVMKGYYKDPHETSKAFIDGWLKTGDLGYIDKDGYLFVTGRIKEIIVLSSGKNVYPEDIEREYLKIPHIKEICIFGLKNKDLTESLHAIVVPDLDYIRKARIANIYEALKWEINRVSMKLPPYMRIKGFTIHKEPLPKTALGKLKRYMISEILKSRELVQNKEEDPRIKADVFSKKVASCVKSVIREDIPISLDDNLELDLGFDSLKRIELTVSLEEIFGVKLPEGFASDILTVRDIIDRLRNEEKKIALSEPREELKRIGLHSGSIERLIVYLLLIIIKVLLRLFFRLELKGLKNIPEDHNFIIAPNHSSYLDGFVIAASLPYKKFNHIFFQGFQRYFRGRISAIFGRLAHVIPIDPETFLSRALEISSVLLRKGYSLCIFPEGGRTFDGNIMDFKKGIGVLSINNNVAVIPTLIEGTFDALPRGAILPRLSKIKVTFGKPLYPSNINFMGKPEIDKYQMLADRVRKEIKRLKEKTQ